MNIVFNNIDSFLESQKMFDLEIIPRKNLHWKGISKVAYNNFCQVSLNKVEIDAVAHSNSDMYRILIPFTREPYVLNRQQINSLCIFTPNHDLEVIFPKHNYNLSIAFERSFFEQAAEQNQLYELIGSNKILSYPNKSYSELKYLILNSLQKSALSTEWSTKLLDKFFEFHTISSYEAHNGEKVKFFTQNVFPLMERNIHKDLSVSDMCEMLRTSRRNFETSFRYQFGLSPASYFRRLKLMKVRKELKEHPDKCIRDLLRNYEINHSGHFGQFYKNIFGTTMKAFQKRMK